MSPTEWLSRTVASRQPAPHLHAIGVTCDAPACSRHHWLARHIPDTAEPTVLRVICHGCESLLIATYFPPA